mmetsp:Transcript_21046/g.54375  ORF Transcript_21046/g.54375 Transcript_21046/m.54375 type:complete len:489 (-) Transcript_21046:226-1692(-)
MKASRAGGDTPPPLEKGREDGRGTRGDPTLSPNRTKAFITPPATVKRSFCARSAIFEDATFPSRWTFGPLQPAPQGPEHNRSASFQGLISSNSLGKAEIRHVDELCPKERFPNQGIPERNDLAASSLTRKRYRGNVRDVFRFLQEGNSRASPAPPPTQRKPGTNEKGSGRLTTVEGGWKMRGRKKGSVSAECSPFLFEEGPPSKRRKVFQTAFLLSPTRRGVDAPGGHTKTFCRNRGKGEHLCAASTDPFPPVSFCASQEEEEEERRVSPSVSSGQIAGQTQSKGRTPQGNHALYTFCKYAKLRPGYHDPFAFFHLQQFPLSQHHRDCTFRIFPEDDKAWVPFVLDVKHTKEALGMWEQMLPIGSRSSKRRAKIITMTAVSTRQTETPRKSKKEGAGTAEGLLWQEMWDRSLERSLVTTMDHTEFHWGYTRGNRIWKQEQEPYEEQQEQGDATSLLFSPELRSLQGFEWFQVCIQDCLGGNGGKKGKT